MRYCVVHKADIPNYGVHAVASSVRFHSRDNRLKGDRRCQRRHWDAGSEIAASGEFGMLSRTLSLATVTLLIGCMAALPVRAQNLEAGKSPSQIFAGTCSACHKAPRGLLKSVPAGSLPGFLRQHYTTSSEMASLLSAYLVSNGATDTRLGAGPPKQGKDASLESRPAGASEQRDRYGRRLRPQEASKPDADGLSARPET